MKLVCGGAGYIGSHMVKALIEAGEKVVVVDNLVTGHKEAVAAAAALEVGDVRDADFMERIFNTYEIDGVYHFCACSLVGESVTNPFKYYDNNVYGTLKLLEAMVKAKVKNIVFSSTAAVYGEPEQVPIVETQKKQPTNPYGESKLAVENLLKWTDNAYGVKSVSLRYFNVAGADPSGEIGEDHTIETHLIPNVLKAAQGKGSGLTLFGDDYPTNDGTCIRDYIFIGDLIEAHRLAMAYLEKGGATEVFNLGSAKGFSVMEILKASQEVTGETIAYTMADRRAGDPAVLIADATKAKEVLGWSARHTDITEVIQTAWQWHSTHHGGYEGDRS